MGRAPRRFVNQAESGTSSKASVLMASRGGSTSKNLEIGRKAMLSAPSQASGETYSSGAQARCLESFLVGSARQATLTESRSVSRVVGSFNGNRGGALQA